MSTHEMKKVAFQVLSFLLYRALGQSWEELCQLWKGAHPGWILP